MDCTRDGGVLAQTGTYTGLGDLVLISADHKSSSSFPLRNMTDLKNPFLESYFASDDRVYVMVATHESPGVREAVVSQPDGSKKKMTVPVGGRKQAIAVFKQDGGYIGSIYLKIPFSPEQFGVFPDGTFLVGGIEGAKQGQHARLRAALFSASGDYERDIELEGDPLADRGAFTKEDWFVAIGFSHIVADGDQLLMVRPTQHGTVFRISATGEATRVQLQMPEGCSIFDLKATDSAWVAMVTRKISDERGMDGRLVVFDKQTGKAMERFTYPWSLGFALACADEKGFTFATTDESARVILTKLPRS